MPPRSKKAAAKKTGSPAVQEDGRAIVLRTEDTSLKTLQVYHDNPRIGNVDKIAKSLHINGQYRPIVVNVGTHTGRPNEIVAGNHTYLGARKELHWQSNGVSYDKQPWLTMQCSFIDVDDDRCKAIVVADNKTADEGTYDDDALARQIAGIPEYLQSGTGFDADELDAIFADLEDDEEPDEDEYDEEEDTDDYLDDAEAGPRKKKFQDTDLGDEDEADEGPKFTVREKEEAREQGIDLDKVSSDIAGALQLTDEPVFDDYSVSMSGNQYPRLIPDMLMTPDDLDIDNLATWAGSASKGDDNEDRQWFYNYGIDSTSGMHPEVLRKMIVAFFTWDDYFENFWQQPAKYTAKIINTKVKFIATPDFSPQTEMGNVFLKWQLYRSRYLGRYFQEAGLKLLPHLIWPDGDLKFLEEETLATMPDEVPLLLQQTQTIDPKKVTGGMDHFKKQLQLTLDVIKPEAVLLYTGKPGLDLYNSLKLGKTKVIPLQHRQGILSEANKGRTRKTTL